MDPGDHQAALFMWMRRTSLEFLTRPKSDDFGLVGESIDTYAVQFLTVWPRKRVQFWSFLASSKTDILCSTGINGPKRFGTKK